MSIFGDKMRDVRFCDNFYGFEELIPWSLRHRYGLVLSGLQRFR